MYISVQSEPFSPPPLLTPLADTMLLSGLLYLVLGLFPLTALATLDDKAKIGNRTIERVRGPAGGVRCGAGDVEVSALRECYEAYT